MFLYRDTNVADRTPNCVNLLFVVHETGVQFLVEAAGLSTHDIPLQSNVKTDESCESPRFYSCSRQQNVFFFSQRYFSTSKRLALKQKGQLIELDCCLSYGRPGFNSCLKPLKFTHMCVWGTYKPLHSTDKRGEYLTGLNHWLSCERPRFDSCCRHFPVCLVLIWDLNFVGPENKTKEQNDFFLDFRTCRDFLPFPTFLC